MPPNHWACPSFRVAGRAGALIFLRNSHANPLICVKAPPGTQVPNSCPFGLEGAMTVFTCGNLLPDHAATVFPLMREAVPGLELKNWLRFARRVTAPRRAGQCGIMVVQRSARPLPCGLFIYRRQEDLTHGPILVAEHFVALDLLDPAPAMRALVEELDRLAKQLSCTAIRAVVLGETSLVASGLREAGHRHEGATLWKQLLGEKRRGALPHRLSRDAEAG